MPLHRAGGLPPMHRMEFQCPAFLLAKWWVDNHRPPVCGPHVSGTWDKSRAVWSNVPTIRSCFQTMDRFSLRAAPPSRSWPASFIKTSQCKMCTKRMNLAKQGSLSYRSECSRSECSSSDCGLARWLRNPGPVCKASSACDGPRAINQLGLEAQLGCMVRAALGL